MKRRPKKDTLKLVVDAIYKNGVPPSFLELSKWTGASIDSLRKLKRNLRELCECAGVVYNRLPSHASQFEVSIYTLLLEFFEASDIIYQHKFVDCCNKKPLPFDFYIKSIHLLIEADGTQHYREGKPSWKYKIQPTDAIKNAFCLQNNIALLRIRYRRYKWNIDHLRTYISTLRLHSLEIGYANCFNCWDGGEIFPISSQDTLDIKKRDNQVYIEKQKPSIIYKRKIDGVYFEVLMDEEDISFLEGTMLFVSNNTVRLSKNGKTLASTILKNISDEYIVYKNNNRLDLRKQNLLSVNKKNFPRSRRITKRTSTNCEGIYKTTTIVKGKLYRSIIATTHGNYFRKSFSYIKYGGEDNAIQAAKEWLSNV